MSNRIDTSALRPRVDPQPSGRPAGADAASVTDRTVRALADSRIDEFFTEGGVQTGIQCDFKERHDFALCGTDSVSNPVLFAKEDGDVDAVDPKDVQQRNLGDCHIMVALAAMANTPEGRATIKGMIRETTNEKGEVSYTVTLHKPEEHWLGLAPTTFTEVHITVDGTFVKGHAEAREAGASQEVWPLVIEKALAKFYGGYAEINRGRSPALALEVLTGNPVESQRLGRFSSFGPSDLTAALSAGKLVVLSTRDDVSGPGSPNLIGEHAYAVTGVATDGGRQVLLLQNPWNRAQPNPIPIEQLDRWFSHVQIGSAR
jgi:Calpain family cysteine protease